VHVLIATSLTDSAIGPLTVALVSEAAKLVNTTLSMLSPVQKAQTRSFLVASECVERRINEPCHCSFADNFSSTAATLA
jgi:hypothetical protein